MLSWKSTHGKMVLIGVWANRNWILGNWLKEVRARSKNRFSIRWVPFIYAGKRKFEKYIFPPLPSADSYFFSYLTIFERYHTKNPKRFQNNSLVLYPHNESEMGDLAHQAAVLNQAFSVYFFCSSDADTLVLHGLSKEKVRIAMCAVDVDCVPDASISRNARNIVLASKFGPRKGLEILPSIVEALPEYNFTALGRGWEEFINTTSLKAARNFKHIQLTKSTRNKHFSEAAIFLTLSNLEGGPVPLIEGIAMGCVPVATKTGFAPDIIRDGQNGFLLNIRPSVSEVCSKIMQASELDQSKDSLGLTWDRITSIMIKDMNAITARNKL